jgi:hypothetical protein
MVLGRRCGLESLWTPQINHWEYFGFFIDQKVNYPSDIYIYVGGGKDADEHIDDLMAMHVIPRRLESTTIERRSREQSLGPASRFEKLESDPEFRLLLQRVLVSKMKPS